MVTLTSQVGYASIVGQFFNTETANNGFSLEEPFSVGKPKSLINREQASQEVENVALSKVVAATSGIYFSHCLAISSLLQTVVQTR